MALSGHLLPDEWRAFCLLVCSVSQASDPRVTHHHEHLANTQQPDDNSSVVRKKCTPDPALQMVGSGLKVQATQHRSKQTTRGTAPAEELSGKRGDGLKEAAEELGPRRESRAPACVARFDILEVYRQNLAVISRQQQ